MPFPGFCVPLNPTPSFTGLTVAAGGLGGRGFRPSPAFTRCPHPSDLQALLLTSAAALEPSSFMRSWSRPLKSNLWLCPTPSTTHVWTSVLHSSSVLLRDPRCPGMYFGTAKWFGVCTANLWGGVRSSLHHQSAFSNPAPAFPDTFICKFWGGKIRSDFIQMCREKNSSFFTNWWLIWLSSQASYLAW